MLSNSTVMVVSSIVFLFLLFAFFLIRKFVIHFKWYKSSYGADYVGLSNKVFVVMYLSQYLHSFEVWYQSKFLYPIDGWVVRSIKEEIGEV
jgi:magnesium-transporting ATPase (P-type)